LGEFPGEKIGILVEEDGDEKGEFDVAIVAIFESPAIGIVWRSSGPGFEIFPKEPFFFESEIESAARVGFEEAADDPRDGIDTMVLEIVVEQGNGEVGVLFANLADDRREELRVVAINLSEGLGGVDFWKCPPVYGLVTTRREMDEGGGIALAPESGKLVEIGYPGGAFYVEMIPVLRQLGGACGKGEKDELGVAFGTEWERPDFFRTKIAP